MHTSGLDAAFFDMQGGLATFAVALAGLSGVTRLVLIADDLALPADIGAHERLGFGAIGLDTAPFEAETVADSLRTLAGENRAGTVLVVDMGWGWKTPAASANFDVWGALCGGLAAEGLRLISLYDWQVLIGDQMLAALRGHKQFLAASGLYDNPFWLPGAYLSGATLREQISFLLARTVPDLAPMVLPPGGEGLASGLEADPGSHAGTELRPMQGLGLRWKIRCFGRLRIYTSGSQQIDWAVPGGSPRKAKALFAYLLQRGESGASADRIAELLWPDDGAEASKRARLHHTVAMLRKVLGGKSFVERRGEYYHLRPPPGTWVDINLFEQFCRRSKALEKSGRDDAALGLLEAADRLYTGELFEDLLPEYIEAQAEDWCLPQRVWLKDMALKVRRDMAVILRRRGKLQDALKQCRRALEMDPACEIAHEEAMRIYHTQGRTEAIGRQYRQYLDALRADGEDIRHPELEKVYLALSASS